MPVSKDDQQGRRTRGAGPQQTTPAAAPPSPSPDTGFRQADLSGPPPPTTDYPKKVTGPPVKPLAHHFNYWGSIDDFNHRVETVSTAYTQAYGIPPTPGLVMDLATSTVDTNDLPRMFTVPLTQQSAKARGAIASAARAHIVDSTVLPAANAADVVTGLADAIRNNRYDEFIATYHDEVAEALTDPRFHDTIVKASFEAGQAHGLNLTSQVLAQSVFPTNPSAFARFVLVDPLRAMSQIATGVTLGLPVLAFKEGQAGYEAVRDKSLAPIKRTNVELAKQSYHGIGQDIHHPETNAGNLFLDLLAGVSLGAGGVARLSAAGRAALADEGATAVAKALVRKPQPGTFTIRKGDASAETLLSDNAAVRAVQRTVFNLRQQGMDARHDLMLNDVPAGAQTAVFAERLGNVADSLSHPLRGEFSFENKLGRTVRAELRVEQALRMSLRDPLNHAANLSVRMSKLGPRVERGLSVGEQKAIQVLLTDVAGGPDAQIAVNRAFHERMIELGVGDAEAHRNQLRMVDLAQKVLAKPPRPKFARAIEDVNRVIDEMETAKAQYLGLDPTTAESRVARVGAMLRDEQTHEPAYLTDGTLAAQIADLEEKLTGNLAEQDQFKTQPRSAERASGGPTEGRAPDATLRGLRRAESELRTRIDALKATQTPITLERVNPSSRYLPYTSAAKSKGGAGTFYGPTIGPYGIALPGSLPELNHEFTGHFIQAGDFRVDATGLAGEAYGRAVRTITKWNAWRRLWQSSVPRQPGGEAAQFYEPIRDVSGVPDDLRKIVNKVPQGELTSEEAAQLAEGDLGKLETFLFPTAADLTPDEMQHIRWFDRRMIADERRGVPSNVGNKIRQGFVAVNEPIRDLTLFAKPSYLLNLVGSSVLALIDQGLFAVPNVYKAITAESRWGRDIAKMLDATAGESRTLSFAPDMGPMTRVSRTLAEGWNKVTDAMFRRAAAIHWLHRLGVTDEEIPNVLRASLRDPEAMKLVSEASRRAKKGMVEMDNLTPVERDWLRHIVFVYPWTSRSLIWSLRTIAEHPVQTATYAEIGKETEQEFPEVLKRIPDTMKRSGYFPIGWTKDGKPKLANPGSVNTYSTLAEFAGLANGSESIETLFGPGAELAIHIATNRDQWGRSYQTPVVGPLTDLVAGLPQYAAVKRAQQTPLPDDTQLDYTNDRALIERQNATLHGASKQPVFVPEGFWRSFWPLAVGGLHAKVLNTAAVNARFWRDQPLEKRNAHEKQLIEQMVTLEGQVLKRPVPHDVLTAVDLASDLSLEIKKFADDNGRGPTGRERAQMSIDFLHERKRVDDKTAALLRTKLDKLPSDQIGGFTSGLYRQYADGKALSQWHDDVRTVAGFTPDALAYQVNALRELGVDDSSNLNGVDFKHLHQLGRRFLDYQTTVAKMQAEITRLHGTAQAEKKAALSLFIEQHDAPVKIDGHQFPSLPRLDVARMTDGQRQQMIRSLATRSWGSLNSLEKTLLGHPTDPVITRGWDGLRIWMKEAQDKLPPGEHLPPNTEAYYAKLIAKKVPGFTQDRLFAEMPLAQRLQRLPRIAPPDHRDLWNELLTAAAQRYTQMKSAGWDHAGISAYWQHNDAPRIEEWLNEHPDFKREVNSMGSDFVYRLVD